MRTISELTDAELLRLIDELDDPSGVVPLNALAREFGTADEHFALTSLRLYPELARELAARYRRRFLSNPREVDMYGRLVH